MPVTIREQSAQLKAVAAERLPAEVVDVFDRSIQDLLDEGVPPGVITVGDTLDSFTLKDATDAPALPPPVRRRANELKPPCACSCQPANSVLSSKTAPTHMLHHSPKASPPAL